MANILILDDSIDLLEALQLILNSNGHKTVATYETDSFMQELEDNKPDLILIDATLRNVDGREVCQQLKAKEEIKSIPIILSSGNPQKLKEFGECNADAVLEKPFNLLELLEKISDLLAIKFPLRYRSNML